MTDEEMAEESFKKYRTTDEDYEDLNGSEKMLVFNHEYGAEKQYRRLYKQGFLAGLKAGRPQWHDLEKDPNDLPKKNGEYLCKVNSHWEKYGVKHFTLQPYGYNRQWEGQGYSIIAWCEIPTFDKE